MEDKLEQSQPPREPIHHKNKAVFFIIAVLILILLSGRIGYMLGVKAGEKKITQISLRITPTTTPLQSTITNLPTLTPIICPPAPADGEQSQTYTWKTYTCQSLGVSFQYPTNIKPGLFGNNVTGFNDYVQIDDGMGYILRIAKFVTNQSLSDWWKRNSDNLSSSLIITQTTFHGYPAYSVEQTPKNIQGQVPGNYYIVKVSPTTLYDIQYVIPDPRYPQDTQENYLLTTGMQKILDSITFLTAQ